MAEMGHHDLETWQTALYAVLVVLLVLGAGLMSGLTLGLLSLDVMDLKVLQVSGTPRQQHAASRLIPLVTSPHWLLCTLLLCNAGCMEALPLFLDRLLDPVGAILLSVTAILVFGELAACGSGGWVTCLAVGCS
jgi:metal transporter CNNM